MAQKRKRKSIESIRQRYGYTFVAHWIIGLIFFFITPVASSLLYSFSNVTIGERGIEAEFIGVEHFRWLLQEDPNYLNNLRDSLGTIAYSLPLIFSLSLILAVLLNRKFVGKTFFRAVFFLPVIIAASVVIRLMTGTYVRAPLFTVSSGAEYSYGGLIDFNSILSGLQLPAQINDLISDSLRNVFNLIWNCGVQTILFLAGLQSISPSLYEVSKIEGANKWEEFWFVTVPMLRHVITLVLIYTMIELFTAIDNPVMQSAYSAMRDRQIYDRSSAMLWFYFMFVIAIIGVVLLLYNRLCVKRWE